MTGVKRPPSSSPYDALVSSYDARARTRTVALAKMLARTRLLATSRVLDLGVGTGLLWETIRRLGVDCGVIGIDLSAGMLARARGRLGAGLCAIRADFQTLPIRMHSVDTVLMAFSARHTADLTCALSGVTHVLSAKGRLVLLEYSTTTQLQLAPLVMGCYSLLNSARDEAGDEEATLSDFAPCREDELIDAATQAGLSVTGMAYVEVLEANGAGRVVDFVMNSPPVVFDLVRCPQRARDTIRKKLLEETRSGVFPRRVFSKILCCVMQPQRSESR